MKRPYDEILHDIPPASTFLQEEIKYRKWGAQDLSERSGLSLNVVKDILSGKKKITSSISKILGETFDVSPDLFFNIEMLGQHYGKR